MLRFLIISIIMLSASSFRGLGVSRCAFSISSHFQAGHLIQYHLLFLAASSLPGVLPRPAPQLEKQERRNFVSSLLKMERLYLLGTTSRLETANISTLSTKSPRIPEPSLKSPPRKSPTLLRRILRRASSETTMVRSSGTTGPFRRPGRIRTFCIRNWASRETMTLWMWWRLDPRSSRLVACTR